ncbi:hypothetical protein BIFGAL_03059 [Bifidobacterium gallicum DSM 20093 = LMG 11596]|uniref:Uncharacterized protein n=1 Tax=Bifidobacterium gallicum DSM 20093 = LMG 11596 TaxID=561180 RepID=D1NTA2_9BIFI|nr:hypothetical protein BIFGAL_03059 [Bifidobacterium gallicum DSM 20093 = LMG 11596]
MYHGGTLTLRISPRFARVCTTVVQTHAFWAKIRIAAVPPWYVRDTDSLQTAKDVSRLYRRGTFAMHLGHPDGSTPAQATSS